MTETKTGQALRSALMVARFKEVGIVRKTIFVPLVDWPEVKADAKTRREKYLAKRQEMAHERTRK